MKKLAALTFCIVLVLSLVGCGTGKTQNTVIEKAKSGDTTVKIEGIVYYNTKKAVSVAPDESVIVREELPLEGSISGEKITAYAFISEEKSGDVPVCLIDGEWYQFAATDHAGQP